MMPGAESAAHEDLEREIARLPEVIEGICPLCRSVPVKGVRLRDGTERLFHCTACIEAAEEWDRQEAERARRAKLEARAESRREQVAKIVREAMEDAGRSERLNTFVQNSMWDYTDRILALLRALRAEGAASTPRSGVFWWFGWSGDESHMQPTALYRSEPDKGTRMVAEWCGTRDDALQLIATLDAGLAALRSEVPGEKEARDVGYMLGVLHAAEHVFGHGQDLIAAELVDEIMDGFGARQVKDLAKAESVEIRWSEVNAIRADRRGEGGSE